MKNPTLFLVLLSLCIGSVHAQGNFSEQELLPVYKDYTELPREIAYVHLNKSVYIKGENIGLNAYVMDKGSLQPSVETTNLYCTISDDSDKLVKGKMLLVTNGTARGDFEIDSLFTSGEYTLRAYTNWMNNFKEHNFFAQKITVIDPGVQSSVKANTIDASLDVQFLPEGGHSLVGAVNNIGVAIKDSNGFGIPFLEGKVFDKDNNLVTDFKVDRSGIGKFFLRFETGKSYIAKIPFNGKDHHVELNAPDRTGVVMEVYRVDDQMAITLRTNPESLPSLKGRRFTLALHNGNVLKTLPLTLKDDMEEIWTLSYSELLPGMNIFTLFDDRNNPILERLFFNYEGLVFNRSQAPKIKKANDSIWIDLPYKNVDLEKFNNISISVLPGDTQSYGHHHNLSSHSFLKPYIKGTIEDAGYYFTDIDPQKKAELDNLLLTQGWSSYDWDNVFNDPPDYDHDFEKGIGYTANSNNSKGGQFLIYPNTNTSSEIILLEKGETTFQKNGIVPVEGEKIRIGEVQRKGKVTKTSLYLQFDPAQIPDLNIPFKAMGNKPRTILNAIETDPFNAGIRKTEQLSEVVLTKKVVDTRIERLRNQTLGKIDVFDDQRKRTHESFASYISQRGFEVDESTRAIDNPSAPSGGLTTDQDLVFFSIINTNPSTPNNNVPLIYLDGIPLFDFSVLKNLRMEDVDYIEINKSGTGGGLRGGAGIIKIVRDPNRARNNADYEETYQAYDIPLNFSAPKRFYVPKYSSYDTRFFREYGTIDWFPDLKLNAQGNVQFKVLDTGTPVLNLYIDGFMGNGNFVSETKVIEVPSN